MVLALPLKVLELWESERIVSWDKPSIKIHFLFASIILQPPVYPFNQTPRTISTRLHHLESKVDFAFFLARTIDLVIFLQMS